METKKVKQPYDEAFGLKAPENYERYFIPAIGRPLANDLIRLAAPRPGEKVLDVACGTGVIARLAAEKVGDTGSVTGLDINPGMLAVARSINPSGKAIEWYEASAEEMPLPDNNFDVVLCQLGFQFMEDKPGALREMRRVLAPGGRIFLTMPGPAGPVFAIFANAMERNINAEAAGFVHQVFSLHDTNELQNLMQDAGFKEVVTDENYKLLHLPPPGEFLWQYLYSTPLAGIVSSFNEETRNALEHEIVEKWQDFVIEGAMQYKQRVVTVTGRK